ncbi:MAG: hypothetical protein QOE14_1154, partial [Humisphaera sp.]|nr:hypothetical protein [Humisphaera sp.]
WSSQAARMSALRATRASSARRRATTRSRRADRSSAGSGWMVARSGYPMTEANRTSVPENGDRPRADVRDANPTLRKTSSTRPFSHVACDVRPLRVRRAGARHSRKRASQATRLNVRRFGMSVVASSCCVRLRSSTRPRVPRQLRAAKRFAPQNPSLNPEIVTDGTIFPRRYNPASFDSSAKGRLRCLTP